MRNLTFLMMILSCIACLPSTKIEKVESSHINLEAPYLWSDKSFPKTIQLSNDFSNEEVEAITEMSEAWKVAVESKVTFFNYGARTSEISSNLNNLDQFYDGVMGIYKTANWPYELPYSALAVTQLFGRRHNVGTEDEFVNIEHADIMLNDDHFIFSTGSNDYGYDLRTVILHEMGHFLGLQHNTSSSRDFTVMYPSIFSTEEKRVPQSADKSDLASKYGITLSDSSSAHAMSSGSASNYVVDDQQSGEPIKILIELMADGECVHKVNGAVTQRHQLKF